MQRITIILVLYASIIYGQDYQDYPAENVPRPAAPRLRASSSALGSQVRPTPVPILKQINKHNEDGSYTYGFEGADGSFKIETKLATGEVKGKYGYVDETGKVRVVEYGANKYGFQPSGEGITVAPPTLVDETKEKELPDYEDEQPTRPQRPHRINRPQVHYQPVAVNNPAPVRVQPQYIQYEEEESEPEPPRQQLYTSVPKPSSSGSGPTPPRVQIPGAQRITDVIYTAVPKPVRPEYEYSQSTSFGDASSSNVRVSRPIYAPAPVAISPSSARAHGFLGPPSGGRPHLEPFQFAGALVPLARPTQPTPPQPQPTQVRYQAAPHQSRSSSNNGGGGLLDQLARDYALPEGSAQPLHDITFGYY